MYASFPFNNQRGFVKRLLEISSLKNMGCLTAFEHTKYIRFVFGKLRKGLVQCYFCLIGDNFNTKKSEADMMQIPLIRCTIHRFSLAAKDMIESGNEVVEKVNKLMSKLKNLVLCAKLKKLCNLCAVTRHVTRCSYTSQRMFWNDHIKQYLPDLNCAEVDALSRRDT